MRWRLVAVIGMSLLVCAVVGALLDQIHVQSGALSYERADLLGQPWWVAPQFGLLLTLALVGAAMVPGGSDAPSGRSLAWSMCVFVGAYVATGMCEAFTSRADVRLALLIMLVVVALVSRRWRWSELVVPASLVIVGCAWESNLVSTGAFTYEHRDLFGVPFWLAGIYACGAGCALDIGRLARHRISAQT